MSATASEGSTLAASGPGSPRSAPGSSAPSSPTARGTSGSRASRAACSWSTRTGRARSPRSRRPSARRSSRRSPSTPPRGATTTTGRPRGHRSGTAAARLAGHGIDIRGGGAGLGGYVVGPGSRPPDRSGLHPGGLRHADPAGARLARRGAAPGPAAGTCTQCTASGEHVRGAARHWSASSSTRPRSATGTPACTGRRAVPPSWFRPAGSTRRPQPSVLVDAATRTGLPETEARRTIASGLRSGAPCPQAGRP